MHLVLDDKVVATDLLDRAHLSFGLIVSDRLKSLFEGFNLPPHRFYPIKVTHKGILLPYFWFHFNAAFSSFVDFDKSEFELVLSRNYKIVKCFQVKDNEELRKISNQLGFDKQLRIKRIYIKKDFPNYDIFANDVIEFSNIISEKLLIKIASNNISGVKATECYYLHNVS